MRDSSMKTKLRLAAACSVAMGLATPHARAMEPNDSFGQRTVLSTGVLSVWGDLTGEYETTGVGPDTVLGVFEDEFFFLTTHIDDDSSPLGQEPGNNGYGSALFGVEPHPRDGNIYAMVSGHDDFNFDGFSDERPDLFHNLSGEFELIVQPSANSSVSFEPFSLTAELQPGQFFYITLTPPELPTGRGVLVDLIIDNGSGDIKTVGGDDLYDFWTFTGLKPSGQYRAHIGFTTFDTTLGWFDEAGNLLAANDDASDSQASELTITADEFGNATLAVGGHPDLDFDGFGPPHAEHGSYQLVLEPDFLQLEGDFNNNGSLDPIDLDILYLAPGQTIDGLGLAEWLALAGSLVGDANLDGTTDAFDFAALAANFNQPGGWSSGDFNFDGNVDAFDFAALAANFNQSFSPSPVPEPAGGALLTIGTLGLARRRQRQS